MSNQRKKIQVISFSAIIIAILAMMSFIPQLGMIQVGIVAITLMHIPTLVGAITFKSWRLALVSGTTFGICSLLIAMTRATTPADILFQNPLVSVMPRIAFGLVAYALFITITKIVKIEAISVFISTIIATIFHTTFVLLMLYLFGQELFPGGYIALVVAVAMSNGIIELIIAAIIVPLIVITLRKALKIDKL